MSVITDTLNATIGVCPASLSPQAASLEYDDHRARAAALDLLIALIDAARRLPAKPSAKIDEIAKRIQNAPNADYPVDALAEECGVSISSFSNSFKRSKGLPLHAYVLNCRIDKARRLLSTTKRSVSSIGQELGFYSTQHFANTFRRVIGATPREYRTD